MVRERVLGSPWDLAQQMPVVKVERKFLPDNLCVGVLECVGIT
jgi:hypothetical protein